MRHIQRVEALTLLHNLCNLVPISLLYFKHCREEDLSYSDKCRYLQREREE